MVMIVEILPDWRQTFIYSTSSVPWLIMTWRHKKPGHQQQWYWPSYHGIFRFQFQKGLTCQETKRAFHFLVDTIECHYTTVQYNMILHTSLQWLWQNINESLDPQKTPQIARFMGPTWVPSAPGGVLGWVSDRDAQHRSLTRNATKGQKGGSKLYISPSFDQKKGVKIRHFPHFCSNIGVEIIQFFQRPEKGGVDMAEHM